MRQLIPQGLAEMAPGPELGVLLAGIDIHALTGTDTVEVLQARARQLSYEQARLLATMVEVGLCDPDAGPGEVARLAKSPPYAADEIRAALAWTRRAADRELGFAETLVLRMPPVFTALQTGQICRSKAWVLADMCADLTTEQAHVVFTRLLPRASRLTTGELAARIKKLAVALDPDWAARRYATAIRERTVIGYLDQDGTATVTGSGLPVEEAAAACAHVEQLARAAKRAGHPDRIGPLRADIYLGLLDGRWQHLTRAEIIADLLTRAASTTDADADPDHPITPPPGGEDAAVTDSMSVEDTPADQGDPGDQFVEASEGGVPVVDEPSTAQTTLRVGVEVRVGLSTLLGRDRHPGEIPGWGTITAEIARTIVAAQRAAEWRYAVTDPDGQLILAGTTRRRPHITPEDTTAGLPPCRGGIVELQVPATLLTELATDPDTCGVWAAVVIDIAAQYTEYVHSSRKPTDGQNPTARFAGAVLRRHVQVRDRTCVHPGCRCPARHADLDHTLDHALGGLTTETNSGPTCQHDHALKHRGGWRLCQPEAGHFVWISPLGRVYHTQPPPITDDLPKPLPRPGEPDYPYARNPEDDGAPILNRPPPPPDPPPPPEPPDPDEPPPFSRATLPIVRWIAGHRRAIGTPERTAHGPACHRCAWFDGTFSHEWRRSGRKPPSVAYARERSWQSRPLGSPAPPTRRSVRLGTPAVTRHGASASTSGGGACTCGEPAPAPQR